MSVWSDIDAMQKRFDAELSKLREHVGGVDHRAAGTVAMREDGLVSLTYLRTELTARTCAVLRERFDELVAAKRAGRSA